MIAIGIITVRPPCFSFGLDSDFGYRLFVEFNRVDDDSYLVHQGQDDEPLRQPDFNHVDVMFLKLHGKW